jgi:predicted nuclease of restriction endonuclease-like (RecB) superfamily
VRAVTSLNREMLALYWEIGRAIVERQEQAGWGDAVIDRLARDLGKEFPTLKGFSRRNLFLMRQCYLAYRNSPNCATAVAQIPWSHNMLILNGLSDPKEREWYLDQTLRNHWSRNHLRHLIETGLYQRQALPSKSHNFDRTLPPPQSDLAQELLKDPYHFDFLDLGPRVRERDLERALTEHLREFLLELGVGFAFMGSRFRLEVGGRDYFVDLLFYHLRIRCHVAIDLKMDEFSAEDAGKMNFYLSALDDRIRRPEDGPTIGIILCRDKDGTTVEFALRDTAKPIGVSEYRLTSRLPRELRDCLPSAARLRAELRREARA